MTAEPMKCANGCGDYVWETLPKKIEHIQQHLGRAGWAVIQEPRCNFVATLPTLAPTKSEGTKPVKGCEHEWNTYFGFGESKTGYTCCSRCGIRQRPPLPTSREWLEEDGERWVGGAPDMCRTISCMRRHDDEFREGNWHIAASGKIVHGRWYTDGPFWEAK